MHTRSHTLTHTHMHTHFFTSYMYYVHIHKLIHINHLLHFPRPYILVYLLCVDHKRTDRICPTLLLLVFEIVHINSKPLNNRKAVSSSYGPSKPDVSKNSFSLEQIGPHMVYISPSYMDCLIFKMVSK